MADAPEHERFTLRRWSQRKHAAAREARAPTEAAPAAAPQTASMPAAPAFGAAPAAPPAPLPNVESLTFDDDFTAFMKPEVDPSLRRAALKKLVSDPRFNVMDGLDVYIDDYSKPDPIEPEMLARLAHTRYLFDPPKTRINDRGEVEDVPPDEVSSARPAGEPATGDAAPAIADAAGASTVVPDPQTVPDLPAEPSRRETT